MTNKLNYTYLDRINNALSFPSQTTPLSPAHGLISNTNNKLVLLSDSCQKVNALYRAIKLFLERWPDNNFFLRAKKWKDNDVKSLREKGETLQTFTKKLLLNFRLKTQTS